MRSSALGVLAASLPASFASAAIVSSGILDTNITVTTPGGSESLTIDVTPRPGYEFGMQVKDGPGASLDANNKTQIGFTSYAGRDSIVRFDAGDTIDGIGPYTKGQAYFLANYWTPGQRGYVGMIFDIAGSDLNGWVEFTFVSDISLTIHRWAYEDVPGVPILAGATGSTSTGGGSGNTGEVAAANTIRVVRDQQQMKMYRQMQAHQRAQRVAANR